MGRLVLAILLVLGSATAALADAMEDWRQAYDAQSRGDNAEAIRLYTRVVQSGELSGENLAKVYTNRAIVHHNADQTDAAIADYTQALKIKSDFADAWVGRCGVYSRKQLYDQAIADCDRGVALNRNYFLAYYNRGVALFHKAMTERALADFTKAIGLKPDYALAYSFRCYIYVAEAEQAAGLDALLSRAAADCDKALQLSPGEASATRSLARIAELRRGGSGAGAVVPGGPGQGTLGGQTGGRGPAAAGGLRQDGGHR